MGKKVKRKTYVSKGQRPNIASSTLKAVARGKSEVDKALDKLAAWRAGKNPWITVPGPSRKEAFVRVRANAVYGDPKGRPILTKTEDRRLMSSVLIYSKPQCPYCDYAKKLFNTKGVAYTEAVVGDQIMREDFVAIFPGVKTLPLIFVNGEKIGGYTDLVERLKSEPDLLTK